MITIGEEMLLLMLDYDTGWYNTRLPPRSRRNAISGALPNGLHRPSRGTGPSGTRTQGGVTKSAMPAINRHGVLA
jgi:hypothetical protein